MHDRTRDTQQGEQYPLRFQVDGEEYRLETGIV